MNGAARIVNGSARGVCALVPIKQRERCKTRLQTALAPAARLALVRSMLSAVLAAARGARTVREVVVISPERDAVPVGIPVMNDTGASLNEALAQAYATLCERGWRELVILPADLPHITAAEVDALVRRGQRGGFAIAPDLAGGGTNALYLAAAATTATASAAAFRFQFGPDSCRLHREEARRLGLQARVVHLFGLAFDVDTPADLIRLNRDKASEPQPWPATLRA